MCGIGGFAFEQGDAGALLAALGHRGPDDEGTTTVLGVTLVHRRLSIIDLSPLGHQPMSDGERTIAFNGEIYNYVELARELEGLGHRFRSRSDTEVLLESWSEWGPEALGRLAGMFAFALVDRPRKTLFLVRDFFGIKPLYWARYRAGLAFASEIPALLAATELPRRANPERLRDYLASGLTDASEETLFQGVRQLLPGHYLAIPLDRPFEEPRPVRYWSLEPAASRTGLREAAEQVRETFLENVRIHLRSDVPVGAALSGGVDSSSIVMAMRKVGGKDLELHAFGFIADDPAVSEERWIDEVVAASGARIHKVSIRPDELVSDLERLIAAQGEPFGSTSIYAQHCVFRRAREAGVKVMLDGQGADELLAGYVPCVAARLVSLLRQRRLSAVSFLASARRFPGRERLAREAAQQWLPAKVRRAIRAVIPRRLEPAEDALSEPWFRERGAWPPAPRVFPREREALRALLVQLVRETSLPMLLRYEDRNSMAHSIESRVPFLTPSFARLVLGLDEELLVARDGTSKAVFREAMRGIVPDAILDRRDKIGFATPEEKWLRALEPWAQAVLSSDAARRVRALDLEVAKRELAGALAGTRPFSSRLWRWINVVRWAEVFSVSFD